MTISKTSAIRMASKSVSKIIRTGQHSFVFYAPRFCDKIDGPSTEIQCNSYTSAVSARTECVADVALALMGVFETYVQAPEDGTTVLELVNIGLKK